MSAFVGPRSTGVGFHYLEQVFGVFLIFLYAVLFIYLYRFDIFPRWGYFGFRLDAQDNAQAFLGVGCVIVAYWFLPMRANFASDYVLWLLFILSYIPIQITLGLSDSVAGGVGALQGALLFSFILSVVTSKMVSKIVFMPQIVRTDSAIRNGVGRIMFTRTFILAACLLVALLVLKFRSIMSFAGIEGVYEQRANANEFGIGVVYGYVILWTSYVFAPLMIAIGFTTKVRSLVFLGLIFLIIIYMITASKTAFVIFGFLFFVHALNYFGLRKRMYMLAVIPIFPMLASMSVDLSGYGEFSAISSYILDQMVIRGIAIQAMIFNLYAEFFGQNPYTYYSHVTGISLLVEYPYQLPVGRVISMYQYGHPDTNANSGVWATDGIASGGAIGLIIAGVMIGLFLGFVNRMTKNVGHRFLSLTMIPLALLLVNVSMFTTVASGGGLALVFLVRRLWTDFTPPQAQINS